jgi:Eco57I restriction-modification methylase
MASLPKELRKQLENAVKKARRVADEGARKALEGLAVAHHEPWPSMSAGNRNLRNRLRVHGRQLGDKLDAAKGTQAVSRLASEVGYEHWHRMLFARFLAECDLLIEPESGVAVSIDEVRELARAQGDDWIELASAWAQRMLPQIFRSGDPVLEVSLAPETRQELESILEALPHDIFIADDSLGWVYQFWQAERKDEVNAAGNKIGADELPAVTQLFTEDYMVLFLLHNTLGAWWAGKVLAARPELAKKATSEDELRTACKVGDIEWAYLRFVRDGDNGPWRPAAGTFDGWPEEASEIRVLDPCMGSGHFLVFALPILGAFRMTEQKLSREQAVDAVLQENLHGLEIDLRCTQIAAFNLALAAWRMVGYRALPSLNLACSGLGINAKEEDWLRLTPKEGKVREAMKQLYNLFELSPVAGSLLDLKGIGGDLFTSTFENVKTLLESALAAEETDEKLGELAVTAKGIVHAAALISDTFTLVATNVPYLGQRKFGSELLDYCKAAFPASKADIATCFLERAFRYAQEGSCVALVTPQSWIEQDPYTRIRKKILKDEEWCLLAEIGARGFREVTGEVVKPILFIAVRKSPEVSREFCTVRVSGAPTPDEKAAALRLADLEELSQSEQGAHPKSRVSLHGESQSSILSEFAYYANGVQTGDLPRFARKFWEMAKIEGGWAFLQTTVNQSVLFGGMTDVLWWENGQGELARFAMEKLNSSSPAAWLRGKDAWERRGILVSTMGELQVSLYLGDLFDNNTVAIIPKDPCDILSIAARCFDGSFNADVRKISKVLKVYGPLVEVPFDRAEWRERCLKQFPNGFPSIESNSAEQWIFSGHPRTSDSPLQVAVARLLNYRWPRQTGSTFLDCPALGPDGLERQADDDGIISLAALKGEPAAADRLRSFLADAFGLGWSPGKLNALLVDAGFPGKPIEMWLRDGFFEEHCDLFQHRPFVWQIWDGVKDGFSALVNYHKLAAPNGEGRKTLESLIYTYLGDWIERQRNDKKNGVEGSDLRLAAAEHLKSELEAILQGEPPYDIFVRWKPLDQQPIGWEPDINDGVRVNIRPFIMANPLNPRGTNASILRVTPGIQWAKDRGKEPARPKEDFPWFWGWDETAEDFAGGKTFDGNRWNDLHYSRHFKEAARRRNAETKKPRR